MILYLISIQDPIWQMCFVNCPNAWMVQELHLTRRWSESSALCWIQEILVWNWSPTWKMKIGTWRSIWQWLGQRCWESDHCNRMHHLLVGVPICWSLKGQKGVTLSSSEVEHVVMLEAVKEIRLIFYFLRDDGNYSQVSHHGKNGQHWRNVHDWECKFWCQN
jgi:hypothetical protein